MVAIKFVSESFGAELNRDAVMTVGNRKRLKSPLKHFCALVIFLAAGVLAVTYLSNATSHPSVGAEQNVRSQRPAKQTAPYGKPVRLVNLEDSSVNESSGIVASRRNPNLFLTHNDSGGGVFLYAFDRAGHKRGVWKVANAEARDWEDIAAGPGPRKDQSYLYVGDIGDNLRRRETIIVYRFPEPVINSAAVSSTKKTPLVTETAEAIRLKYPDGKHDAEALMVHPATGDLYVVTKSAGGGAGVYKVAAPLTTSKVTTLSRVAEIRLPSLFSGMVTGGDISPDGLRVVLCDYLNAYEISLPTASKSGFDEVWKKSFSIIETGTRQQGEAVCYRLDGKAILLTSEKLPTPLIEITRNW